jgi:hypothetical protein
MLSQIIPSVKLEIEPNGRRDSGGDRACSARSRRHHGAGGIAARGLTRGGVSRSDEPLRVQLHEQAGLEREGLDTRDFSRCARTRRVRGALRPSGTGFAGAGCGGKCSSERNRRVFVDFVAIFGRTGPALDGVVRDERNSESRSGGASHPDRKRKVTCRDQGRGVLRGSRSQVPDLGAGAVSCASGGGAREGAGAQADLRGPGSDGDTASPAHASPPGVREQ